MKKLCSFLSFFLLTTSLSVVATDKILFWHKCLTDKQAIAAIIALRAIDKGPGIKAKTTFSKNIAHSSDSFGVGAPQGGKSFQRKKKGVNFHSHTN
jgi:hypothetical protein